MARYFVEGLSVWETNVVSRLDWGYGFWENKFSESEVSSQGVVLGDTCGIGRYMLLTWPVTGDAILIASLRAYVSIELLFFCRVIPFLFLCSILWKQVTKSSPPSRGEELSFIFRRGDYRLVLFEIPLGGRCVPSLFFRYLMIDLH